MSRTVTALYDTRAEAESARDRLSSAVDVDSVKIIDQGSSSGSGGGQSRQGGHSSALSGVHMAHEDRHAYGEGLRRGGAMLCAEVDSDEDTDKIIQILEQTSSVDMDDRQNSWRNEGWQPYGASSGSTGGFGGSTAGTSGTGGTSGFGATSGTTGTSTTGTQGNTVQEEHIPIVEEELRVGKREVTRGGARVRSYIKEVPVHEQVTLREEHVSVERRPVSDTMSTADLNSGDLLRERTVEMTETAEEAVVAKQAHVTEEVVVRKTAEEHVENIDDTVRRTEVDIDEGTSGGRSAMNFGRDGGSGTSGSSSGGTGSSGSTGSFERSDTNRNN